ncbi:hypothetical protein T11_5532 [Trichinella zimbabwensis]|uniref:Uncharacterized protein n=1 Tax=Trichinella zimbabwensis TaxID=268475 RepID=A0A0V1HGG1_9BILA|nr:hypothetical protein T11_5532 [Trichinella zimbabwensis]
MLCLGSYKRVRALSIHDLLLKFVPIKMICQITIKICELTLQSNASLADRFIKNGRTNIAVTTLTRGKFAFKRYFLCKIIYINGHLQLNSAQQKMQNHYCYYQHY